ncbi:hypothetical protein [Nocardia sp. NBC_01009]|uniref:hypothetical protein n=1 Tax=Nocardia sp. NBC_01009 TaxID=2975996 RepID=UPI00386BD4D1|nr:hypothetical protein OHA42_14510 [Nocardia sp. NBC_01009]
MQREHEEAMRLDFQQHYQLGRDMYGPGVTEADIERLDVDRVDIEKRWRSGPHAEHWNYLEDAQSDWQRAPKTMSRFMEDVDHNGGHGLTEIQRRSQEQARELTGNDRTRPRIERER